MKQREEENHGNKIKVRVGVQRLTAWGQSENINLQEICRNLGHEVGLPRICALSDSRLYYLNPKT